jgi:hypothetical protein
MSPRRRSVDAALFRRAIVEQRDCEHRLVVAGATAQLYVDQVGVARVRRARDLVHGGRTSWTALGLQVLRWHRAASPPGTQPRPSGCDDQNTAGREMKDKLLRVAARCDAISRRTADLTTARELRELAEEVRRMAEQAGSFPWPPRPPDDKR